MARRRAPRSPDGAHAEFTAGADGPSRPLRADARRNRERVLGAARDAFAALGPEAPLDEIARRAGVGAGTIYRHFPTKEALLEAVLFGRLQRLTDEARVLSRAPDAGRAFFDFAERMVEEGAAKGDLVEALAGAGIEPRVAGSLIAKELRAAVGELVRCAQQTGAVRPDVSTADVLAVLSGASLGMRHHRATDSEPPGRVLAVVCDGLRPNRDQQVGP